MPMKKMCIRPVHYRLYCTKMDMPNRASTGSEFWYLYIIQLFSYGGDTKTPTSRSALGSRSFQGLVESDLDVYKLTWCTMAVRLRSRGKRKPTLIGSRKRRKTRKGANRSLV
jgi:hypothetical protein